VFTTSGTYPWLYVTVHRYAITDNQVMVATVKLSKQSLQLNQEEPLVQ